MAYVKCGEFNQPTKLINTLPTYAASSISVSEILIAQLHVNSFGILVCLVKMLQLKMHAAKFKYIHRPLLVKSID